MADARAILAAWLAAIAVVAAIALSISNNSSLKTRPDFTNVETVFLGSSLTRHAVPIPENAVPTLVEQTGRYTRLGIRAARPGQIEDLLEQALDEGVPRVVVELRPFLYRTRNQPLLDECSGIRCRSLQSAEGALTGLFDLRTRFRDEYRSALDLPRSETWLEIATTEPDKLDRVLRADRSFDHLYPLRLLFERDATRLIELVTRAKSEGVDLIFVLYPRSPVANSKLPDEQERAIARFVDELAADLDVDLFAPAADWPNANFHDSAHFNQSGRDRFVREFTQWLEDRK